MTMTANSVNNLLRSISCASLCVALLCLTTASFARVELDKPDHEALVALRESARAYEHGEGVARDVLRAVNMYCDGARNGDAEAQFSLGWIYANGRGVPRSDEMAAYFFKLAASQGHEHAQRMLSHVGEVAAAMPECMVVAITPDVVATAEVEPDIVYSGSSTVQRKVFELVRRLSPEYGVSMQLAIAVIETESNFEPTAVSPKNAQGLMQLIPETSKRFNIKNPFDPEQNIRGGLAYLRWLLAYFEGNVALVAAAYNAGEGAVNRYRGIPPYAETRGYVKKIMGAFKRDNHPYDPNVTAPSPELPRIRTKK